LVSISAVIATRNSGKTIAKCLASLKGFDQIIIVDGNSKDYTLPLARHFNPEIYSDKGTGFFGAYNIGFQKSKSEFIMFLDSDAYLKDFDFETMANRFQNPNLAMIVCLAYAPVTNWVSKLIGDVWIWRNSEISKYHSNAHLRWLDKQYSKFFMSKDLGSGVSVTGPCYVIRKSAIERIGGMNQDADDFVLGKLFRDLGYEIQFYNSLSVYHISRTSIFKLFREYTRFGLRGSQFAKRFYSKKEILRGIFMFNVSMLTTPFIARHSRDARHIVFIPTIRLMQTFGFVIGWLFLRRIIQSESND
jgi:glycosyltransferase involved in cell wall biosynthesis